MYVTVLLAPDVARALTHRQPTTRSEEVAGATRELGVRLMPIHPGTDDGELVRYFAIEVPDQPAADRVIARIRRCAAIDGAYVKPPDGLP